MDSSGSRAPPRHRSGEGARSGLEQGREAQVGREASQAWLERLGRVQGIEERLRVVGRALIRILAGLAARLLLQR